MVMSIYNKALAVLMKKPLRLWGISLLCIVLTGFASILFGVIPGVSLSITLLLETSMTIIFLRGYRGQEVNTLNLFECFRDWKTIKRVLCGMGWMMLWIFLWALIPIVGWIFAIIRSYEYRLTPYILVMEPDVAPTDAIKVSKERTQGWKSKMFAADILVYVLIGAVNLVLGLLGRIPYIGVFFLLILVLFMIVVAVLINLFLGLVKAAFYEEIENNRKGYIPAESFVPAEPVIPEETAAPTEGDEEPHE